MAVLRRISSVIGATPPSPSPPPSPQPPPPGEEQQTPKPSTEEDEESKRASRLHKQIEKNLNNIALYRSSNYVNEYCIRLKEDLLRENEINKHMDPDELFKHNQTKFNLRIRRHLEEILREDRERMITRQTTKQQKFEQLMKTKKISETSPFATPKPPASPEMKEVLSKNQRYKLRKKERAAKEKEEQNNCQPSSTTPSTTQRPFLLPTPVSQPNQQSRAQDDDNSDLDEEESSFLDLEDKLLRRQEGGKVSKKPRNQQISRKSWETITTSRRWVSDPVKEARNLKTTYSLDELLKMHRTKITEEHLQQSNQETSPRTVTRVTKKYAPNNFYKELQQRRQFQRAPTHLNNNHFQNQPTTYQAPPLPMGSTQVYMPPFATAQPFPGPQPFLGGPPFRGPAFKGHFQSTQF